MRRAGLAAVLLVVAGCGPGRVSVTAWGEAFIESGLPPEAFADGAEVKYERFLAVIGGLALATQAGAPGPAQAQAVVVDVTKPGPVELFAWDDVPATKWDAVQFAIAPAGEATGAGAIAAEDVERMRAGGLSLFLEGRVTKGAVTKRFAWGFAGDTRYTRCRSPALGEGLTVPAGGEATLQLTLHGDHPWYDALAGEAVLRAQAIVEADADGDGEVTLGELGAVSLTRFPLGTYDTTSVAGVKTLRDFVTRLTRTIGHYQGEGECDVAAR